MTDPGVYGIFPIIIQIKIRHPFSLSISIHSPIPSNFAEHEIKKGLSIVTVFVVLNGITMTFCVSSLMSSLSQKKYHFNEVLAANLARVKLVRVWQMSLIHGYSHNNVDRVAICTAGCNRRYRNVQN